MKFELLIEFKEKMHYFEWFSYEEIFNFEILINYFKNSIRPKNLP
jgi:hypothetical protein